MATTPNYGWVTPAPTDFVTDLPADFETFADAVDDTLKDLNPETTLGDISYRSATANTNTRLAIGTSGQVLTVSGGVPAWTTISSGGATLISTTNLTGSSTSVTSIPSGYKTIYALILGVDVSANAGTYEIRFNGSTTNHFQAGATGINTSGGNNTAIRMLVGMDIGSGGDNNFWYLKIENYASSTQFKPFELYGVAYQQSVTDYRPTYQFGGFRSNTAITSIEFNAAANTWTAGSVQLYGVN